MSQKPVTKAKKKKRKTRKVIHAAFRKYFLIGVVGLSVLLYLNTLGHQYAFDDSIVITDNPYTQSGISGIPKLLTSDFFEGIYGTQTELTGGRYRPLSLMMFAIEYEVFGLNPLPGHLINILMYALVVFLLFRVLELWFGRASLVPYLATLLFAVHPLHTEVVANIKSRDEILCLVLLLGTLFTLFKGEKSDKKMKWLLVSVLLFFLSLFAKETGITFLVIIPAALFIFRKEDIKHSLLKALPYLGVFLIYFLIRTSLVGMIGGSDSIDIMENPFVNSPFGEKYATIFLILLKYFGLLFFPHPLTSDYSFNQIPFVSFSNIWVILSVLLHIGMGVYMILKIGKRDILAFSILCYLAPLSIVSNLVFNIGAPMGERFLFIPSIGFCLAMAWLIQLWVGQDSKIDPLKKLRANSLAVGLLLLVTLVFSVKTVWRNMDWYDNSTLFRKDVQTSANSAKMQYYYANTFIGKYMDDKKPENRHLLDSAEIHLTKALEINPVFVTPLYNLGLVHSNKDNGPLAKQFLTRTLEIQPNHIKAFRLMGEVHGRLLQDYDTALYYLETARNDYGDSDPGLLQNLANVYALKGQEQKALPIYQELLAQDPQNPKYMINLGLTYQRLGQEQKAQEMFQRAEQLQKGQ